MPDRGAPRGGWAPAGTGGRAGRWSLRLVAHLSPELDHLILKVDHSLGAHGCQSNEFHDYRPYPAVAGKGFVELGEPVEEFPSDNGFGIELYPPHFAERREVGCFFGMGLHLSSVGRLPRPVGRKNLSLAAVAVERLDGDQTYRTVKDQVQPSSTSRETEQEMPGSSH